MKDYQSMEHRYNTYNRSSGNPLDNALMYNDASAVKESKLVESISDNHPIVSTSTNALVRALSLINKLKKKNIGYFIKQIDSL